MHDELSGWLVVYTVLSVLVLLLFHVLQCRLTASHDGSPQARLAKLIVVLNAPLLVGVLVISQMEVRSIGDTGRMLLSAFIVFNGIAYSYFHFFNMCETARRIRMLIQIWLRGGELHRQELIGAYTPGNMVTARLERLVQMRQVSRGADGHYRIDGRLLLVAAYAMEWFKRALSLRHTT